MLYDFQPWGYEWPVDANDPVVRSHRLNDRREGWWLGLPGRDGTKYIFDLMGRAPGTFQNPSATGVRWGVAGARVGGVGTTNPYINQTGTGNYILVGLSPQFNITTTLTVGCWARFTGTQTNRPLVAKWAPTTGFLVMIDPSTNNKVSILATVGGVTKTALNPTATADDNWHRYIGTYDGANVMLYVDGLLVATTAGTGAIASTTTNNMTFGAYGDGSQQYVGHLDDMFVSSRAWSASEVAEDYDLSRRGYPGVLNRIVPYRVSDGASTAGLASANYYYRHLAGGPSA